MNPGGEKRECVICLRALATDADWERNERLNERGLSAAAEDAEAERLGLTSLCWEQEDDGCLGHAIDLGRPTTYLAAMERIAQLQATLADTKGEK